MKTKKMFYIFFFLAFLISILSIVVLITEKAKYIDEIETLKNELFESEVDRVVLEESLLEVSNECEGLRSNKAELEKSLLEMIEKLENVTTDLQQEPENQDDEIPYYIRYNEKFEIIYQLPNAIKIHYGDNKTILVEKNNEKIEIIDKGINNRFASIPLLSSSNKEMVYIAPYEFELNGDVYIYNFENETNRKIVDVSSVNLERDDTAKVLKWLDDDRLLIIIGFAAGTVSRGGDLYLYNFASEDLVLLKDVTTAYNNHEEIVDFVIQKEKVIIEIISWHEDLQNYDTRFEEIDLNQSEY